jgi:hypothetical protein
MADSKFLLGLIASLVISSILIALIVGDNEITLSVDTSLKPEGWVGGSGLTKGVNYYDAYFSLGGFVPNEYGLVSSSAIGLNEVRFTKSDTDGGVYRNKYTITKNGINNFDIIIRDTGHNSDTLILEFSPEKLTLRNDNAMGILIPNSYEQTVFVDTSGNGDDIVLIETVYDVAAKTVNVYIDNIQVALFTEVPEKSILSVILPTYYGGVTVEESGFVINAYESNPHMVKTEGGFDFFAFLNTLAGVLIWYVSPNIPEESSVWYSLAVIGDTFINIIIKIQQIGIIAYAIQMVRGN